MSAGHTPGPWRLAENDPSIVVTEALDADGNCAVVADVMTAVGVATLADLANARLIAAAPELLEACEAVVNHLAIEGSAIQVLIQAAIAKARP